MHSPFLPGSRRFSPSNEAAKTDVRPPIPRIQPSPVNEWPFWTKAVRKFRKDSDAGIGDTIVHLIGDERSERFKKWFIRKFGRSCGCADRQRWLNSRFAYLSH